MKKIFWLVSAFLLVINSIAFVQADGETFQGHRYVVVGYEMSWHAAKAYAEALDGHLVTIGDEAENTFVGSLVQRSGYRFYWIGLTDEVEEGRFVWVTGEEATYTHFDINEPNNLANEDYVEIFAEWGPFGWNDIYDECHRHSHFGPPNTHSFVVEFDGVSTSVTNRRRLTTAWGAVKRPAN